MEPKFTLTILMIVPCILWTPAGAKVPSPYCQLTPFHTLCLHEGVNRSNCENRLHSRGVYPDDAEIIVMLHNKFRSKVATGLELRGASGPQPSACNMRYIEWDYELALLAQTLADQCVFVHECSDCRRVTRFGVGQNLFLSAQRSFTSSAAEWTDVIHNWYNEVAMFDSTNIDPFRFYDPTGRYSQIMWAETYKIGCGFAMYYEGGWWKKLYSCNYGPGGNVISYQMYCQGPPCSSCPEGTVCSIQYPGLCAESPDIFSDYSTHQRSALEEKNRLTAFEGDTILLDQRSSGLENLRLSDFSLRKFWHFKHLKAIFRSLLGLQPYFSKYDPDQDQVNVEDRDFQNLLHFHHPRYESSRVQRSADNVLLECSYTELPCDFSVLGANWTIAENDVVGVYITALLDEGGFGMLIYSDIIGAPASGSICVTFTQLRELQEHADVSIPNLKVGVHPVIEDSDIIEFDVSGNDGIWETASVGVDELEASFAISIAVGPAIASTLIGLSDLIIADGQC